MTWAIERITLVRLLFGWPTLDNGKCSIVELVFVTCRNELFGIVGEIVIQIGSRWILEIKEFFVNIVDLTGNQRKGKGSAVNLRDVSVPRLLFAEGLALNFADRDVPAFVGRLVCAVPKVNIFSQNNQYHGKGRPTKVGCGDDLLLRHVVSGLEIWDPTRSGWDKWEGNSRKVTRKILATNSVVEVAFRYRRGCYGGTEAICKSGIRCGMRLHFEFARKVDGGFFVDAKVIEWETCPVVTTDNRHDTNGHGQKVFSADTRDGRSYRWSSLPGTNQRKSIDKILEGKTDGA